MEIDFQSWTDWIFNIYTLIAWILIVVLGVILGIKKKIPVFRDYNDLGLVFLMGLFPIILVYLFALVGENQKHIGILFIIVNETAFFIWIFIRTLQDNPNPIKALIALISKLSLSVLFIINFLNFVAPEGKTMGKRASVKHIALAFFVVLAPLVFALVKNKEGIFNPQRSLRYRGIGM